MSEELIEETAVEPHANWALRKQRERMIVTRFQAKAVLMQQGLLEQVEAIVEGSADPLVKLAWHEAGFERLSPFIAGLAVELGLSDADVDSLFIAAKQVR